MAENRLFNKGRFKFVGEPIFGKENVLTTEKLKDSGWSKSRLNFGVKNDNNSKFLTTEFIFNTNDKKVRLFGQEGKGFDISLTEDTSKTEILKKVNPYSIITVNLETDEDVKKEYYSLYFKIRNIENRKDQTEEDLKKLAEYREQIKEFSKNVHEFAHIKDMMTLIKANQKLIQGHRVKVTGSVNSNYYKDENRLQFVPNHVEFAKEDEKDELTVNLDIFFEKEGIIDNNEDKKMYINGYVGERANKVDKLVPTQLVLDYSKVDEENAQQKALLDFVKGFFINVKSKKYLYKLPVICSVVNGAEIVEFSEETLTESQKISIALGLNKLEDFKPTGNIYGSRVSFIKLVKPNLKAAPEGAEETAIEVDDLPNYLLDNDSDVKASDIKKEEVKEDNSLSNEDLLSKLFG